MLQNALDCNSRDQTRKRQLVDEMMDLEKSNVGLMEEYVRIVKQIE